jgi:hypothetical protein
VIYEPFEYIFHAPEYRETFRGVNRFAFFACYRLSDRMSP